MIFDVLQVLFSAFICYCLYLVVLVPHLERKKAEALKIAQWLEALEGDKKNKPM